MLGPPPLESPVERLEAAEVAESGVEFVEAGGLGVEAVEVEELPDERKLRLPSGTEAAGSADRPAPPLTFWLGPGWHCGAAYDGYWRTRTRSEVFPSGRKESSPSRAEFCS